MFEIIAKLHEYADRLDELGKEGLADQIDKIASELIEAYKMRIKRQRRGRGLTRIRRKKYYRKNRQKIKRKQKKYRRKRKVQLKRRRKRKHYKRVGCFEDLD